MNFLNFNLSTAFLDEITRIARVIEEKKEKASVACHYGEADYAKELYLELKSLEARGTVFAHLLGMLE